MKEVLTLTPELLDRLRRAAGELGVTPQDLAARLIGSGLALLEPPPRVAGPAARGLPTLRGTPNLRPSQFSNAGLFGLLDGER